MASVSAVAVSASKTKEAALCEKVKSAKTNVEWLNALGIEEPGHKWHRDSSTDKDSLLDTCSPDSALKDRDCGLASVQKTSDLMQISGLWYEVWHKIYSDYKAGVEWSDAMRNIAPQDIGVLIQVRKHKESSWRAVVVILPDLVNAAIQQKK